MNLKRSFRWIADSMYWLARAVIIVLFIFALLLILVTFLKFVSFSDRSFRATGCVLQFAGMILGIWGLLSVWWKQRPNWSRKLVLKVEPLHLNILLYDVQLSHVIPDLTLEKQIKLIEEDINKIKNEQDKQAKYIKDLDGKYMVLREIVLKENPKKIREVLESIRKEDKIKSLLGFAFISVGIIMSTMAPELSKVAPELSKGWQWLAAILCVLFYVLGLLICFPSAYEGKIGE